MILNTSIQIGIVVSNFDSGSKTGKMSVEMDESGLTIDVIYVSPFYHLNGGGVLAIPDIGSKILVFNDLNSGYYYYLGTIIDTPSNPVIGGMIGWEPISEPGVYSERGIPQKVTYTNQVGAGLKISRRLLPNYMTSKVNLDSEKGKRISLSDSPKSDVVLIRNEHGDGIVISSQANDVHADRSIEVKCKGSQHFVSYQAAMNFYLIEGKDISIENFSTGSNSNTTAGEKGRFGNINIKSHNADINITGKGDKSDIFITTPKARIEIKADGSVLIDSQDSVRIQALKNIELKSTAGDISMEALNINMKSTLNTNIQSMLNTSIEATANFTAKGTLLATLTSDASPVVIKGTSDAAPILGLRDPPAAPVIIQPLQPKQKTKTDYGD